jgi:nucleoside-diphosphate-sugar epimerase
MMREIKNCSVAVIGGAGFLGSHLVRYLTSEERKCLVLVIDNFVVGRPDFLPKGSDVHIRDLDITSPTYLMKGLFDRFNIQYVFNYAAYPYVPDSYRMPGKVFSVNLGGAINVINTAQEAGVKGILQVSSAEVYGEHHSGLHPDAWSNISETSPITPRSSYGVSKAAADGYCQVSFRERDTPVIALRQFNCIGERETHPYVVPEIIDQLYSGAPPEVKDIYGWNCGKIRLGNNTTRDFMYAGDAVRAAVLLLERGSFGEVYNLGSEESVLIYDLAQKLSDIVGCGRALIDTEDSRKRKWEIWHLQSDNTKIKAVIGNFSPISLDESLKRTITWYNEMGRKWPWQK